MHKSTIYLIGFAGCAILLILSTRLNVTLYRKIDSYNLLLNEIYLDPLKLGAFSPEQDKALLAVSAPRVIFFGDSRAVSWMPPVQMKNVLFINRGIATQTTAQVLGRLDAHALSLKPSVLVIQVGINDLKTIPLFPDQRDRIVANCKANIRQMVERAVKHHTRVVLTTIFPLAPVPLEKRFTWTGDIAPAVVEVNGFIATLASKDVYILDAAKILSNDEGVLDARYRFDVFHLNAAGYDVLNNELTTLLQHKPISYQ